jgi:hypothetical protein
MEPLESFITENKNETFNDCVIVFAKEGGSSHVSLTELYHLAFNVRSQPQLDQLRRRRDMW